MRLIDADRLKEEMPVWIHGKIDEQPSIDPVKHGHWIDVELVRSYGHMKGVQCSECGHERLKSRVAQPKFCEYCGAEMGGLK